MIESGEVAGAGSLCVLAHLQRKDLDFAKFPVNKVCSKHADPKDPTEVHVLRSRAETQKACAGSVTTSSGILEMIPTDRTLMYKFVCNDSCMTCDELDKVPEKARDMDLVLTILTCDNNGTLVPIARKSVHVWIKATINQRDLVKKTRRLEKGGGLQAAKKAKRTRNATEDREAEIKTFMKKFKKLQNEHPSLKTELTFLNENPGKVTKKPGKVTKKPKALRSSKPKPSPILKKPAASNSANAWKTIPDPPLLQPINPQDSVDHFVQVYHGVM
jgi:hypothetical protein